MLRFIFIFLVLVVGGFFGYQFYERYQEENVDEKVIKAYMPNIVKVNADQVKKLVMSGKRNQRPTLVYVFETDCFLCRWYMHAIIDLTQQYSRKQLNVMVLSLDNDPNKLARYLYDKELAVRPLILKEGEREKLFANMRSMNSSYDGSIPHAAVVNKAGHFDDVTAAFNLYSKLNGFIVRSLDVKV